MTYYRLWDESFASTLSGEDRFTLDYFGAAENSRREAEAIRKYREESKFKAKHPDVEFCETEEEYEDQAEDARQRLLEERKKRGL